MFHSSSIRVPRISVRPELAGVAEPLTPLDTTRPLRLTSGAPGDAPAWAPFLAGCVPFPYCVGPHRSKSSWPPILKDLLWISPSPLPASEGLIPGFFIRVQARLSPFPAPPPKHPFLTQVNGLSLKGNAGAWRTRHFICLSSTSVAKDKS